MSKNNVKVKVTQSHPILCNPMDRSPSGSSVLGDSLGKDTGVGFHSLLQGVFPTQRLNPGLPHCRRILYQLSHKGSPRILEWVPYPISSRSSRPRNQTRVSCIAGGLFTNWAIREALDHQQGFQNWVTLDIFYVSWKWNILEPKQYDMLNVKIMNYDLHIILHHWTEYFFFAS